MLERYKKAKYFTAGIVFFSGRGELDSDVTAEVARRFELRMHNAAKVATKKKKQLLELQRKIEVIKKIMAKKGFKPKDLKVAQLKDFCRWKKQSGDNPLPTKKADLLRVFSDTKGRASPQVSPSNSEVEDDQDDNDDVDLLNSDATAPENDELEFGSDIEGGSEDDENEENEEESDGESM